MTSYRALLNALRDLGLTPHSRVIAHVSLPALGPLAGGAESVLGALLASSEILIMPSFTFSTMVTPGAGPPENGIDYTSDNDASASIDFYDPNMPSDPSMGEVSETLRCHPDARRSSHPILSFVGINAEEALASQTLEEPLAPIAWLADGDGDILLMGSDHTSNTSLHYAERLADRKQFIRWALTPLGIVECPGFPGCSDGFQAIEPHLAGVVRRAQLGSAGLQLVPLRDLIHITVAWLREDPRALLCDRPTCERCRDVRSAVRRVV